MSPTVCITGGWAVLFLLWVKSLCDNGAQRMGTPEAERVNVGPEDIPLGSATFEANETCSRISGIAEPVN